uniref:Uncharacterized protein n=1 Tax=Daphnia galeata TaxID=27404 RepID=A0A8J2RMG8_9CRUS|nr:unnamed protein product [Daphnia galeata]
MTDDGCFNCDKFYSTDASCYASDKEFSKSQPNGKRSHQQLRAKMLSSPSSLLWGYKVKYRADKSGRLATESQVCRVWVWTSGKSPKTHINGTNERFIPSIHFKLHVFSGDVALPHTDKPTETSAEPYRIGSLGNLQTGVARNGRTAIWGKVSGKVTLRAEC